MKARLSLVAILLVLVLPASAQTADQWIARARARLASESTLEGLTSVRYTGTIEFEGTPARTMDIIFQKPLQHRITLSGPELVEVMALDGYDGWQKRSNPKNPTQWQLTLLDAKQIKRLRAQAWDNLNFLRHIEKMNGSVKVAGDETVDGVACVKLVFSYYDMITLTRYYDKSTARLVKTVTENGVEIREEGEVFAGGIRFPKKVTNREKGGRTVVMTFDKIAVNESYPAADFAVPAVSAN